MNRFVAGLVILLVTVIGAYFLFFNNEDNLPDLTPEKRSDHQMKQRFNPGQGKESSHKINFILKENNEESDEIRTMNYTVKNDSDKKVKLEFSSSMKYDFYITDENGNEVYRDSKGKSYLQVLQHIDLAPGEAETFKLKLPELDPGDYTLTAKLAAKGYGSKESSIEFSVK